MEEFGAIFDKDPYCRTFSAEVVSCEEGKKGWMVELSDTAFYPEGGGQPYDTGILGGVKVKEVHKKDGKIIHYCDGPLTPGETVEGTIDWDRRFVFMQMHSGEHIVSGLIHRHFGYENVGFHMGEVIQIDFDGPLDWQQAQMIESEANEVVYRNVEVEYLFPSAEELEAMPYRSKKELSGRIRVVRICDADLCACCGTHVRHTGEIGFIKLLSLEKHKNGVRIEMLAGRKALEHIQKIYDQNHAVSVALSARTVETANAVSALQNSFTEKERKIREITDRYLAARMESIQAGQKLVCLFGEELDRGAMRRCVNDLAKEKQAVIAAVFSREGDHYNYVILSAGEDLRAHVKTLNAKLNGRGGGNSEMIQGSFAAEEQIITEVMQEEFS